MPRVHVFNRFRRRYRVYRLGSYNRNLRYGRIYRRARRVPVYMRSRRGLARRRRLISRNPARYPRRR